MKASWRVVRVLLLAVQLLALGVSVYQSSVTIAGHLLRWVRSSPPGHAPRPGDPHPRFALILCARNEERVIRRLIHDLDAQDYPREAYEVLVVAHNCTDKTAERAREAGATVIEIHTPRPGKSQAIAAGLRSITDGADFIGVFDADSRVSPDFLLEVARRSVGEHALQVESIPQPSETWIGQGHGISRRARNLFWWRPREALGLGTTINGSGFFIRTTLARELIPELRSITEDLELTAHLYASGFRIAYVSTTHVRMEETARLKPMMRQRARWVRGHYGVIRNDWISVARRASRGDARAFDLAVFMLLPTRVITRTGASISALIALVRLPFALPAPLVLLGLVSEWGVPAVIAFLGRLVPRSPAGLQLAARQGFISLLWFPIGVWALLTSRRWSWEATPRAESEGADAIHSS